MHIVEVKIETEGQKFSTVYPEYGYVDKQSLVPCYCSEITLEGEVGDVATVVVVDGKRGGLIQVKGYYPDAVCHATMILRELK